MLRASVPIVFALVLAGAGVGVGTEINGTSRSSTAVPNRPDVPLTLSTAPDPPGPPGPDAIEPAARFGWPLGTRASVSRPFQPPTRPYGPGHRGADLVGHPGQPVLAAADGVVVYAGPLADRGVVSVQHADGLRTTYEPVSATVRAGQRVRRGQPLGSLTPGHLGCPSPACLHWGLRRDGEYLDPLQLVRRARVRLLPWPPPSDPP